jgi:hypothetical protein
MPTPAAPVRRRHLLPLAVALLAAPRWALAQQPKTTGGYTELKWDDLVPKGWDPMKGLKEKGLGNVALLNDGDPKVAALMREMREAWDNAPTEPTLDGAKVRLPGYLVPLEEVAAGHTEFLLVPYFGACIHTPPPPANQIVLVVPARPAGGFRSMDTVWVSGTLKATRSNSPMGSSGYRLEAAQVERYQAATR